MTSEICLFTAIVTLIGTVNTLTTTMDRTRPLIVEVATYVAVVGGGIGAFTLAVLAVSAVFQ